MQPFVDAIASEATGVPLAGIQFYVKNYPSLTLATLYAVNDNTTPPLTQPLRTRSDGTSPFYAADGHYQIVGSLPGAAAIITDFVLQDSTAGFIQTGTGMVLRSLQSKERDTVSAFDAMITAQIADVQAGTKLVDTRASIQAAIDAINAHYAATGIAGVVDIEPGIHAILSNHPTKTFTTPGDDGTLSTGLDTKAAETVYQMPVALWLKEGVTLNWKPGAIIAGTWAYATTSPINTSQTIGILVSSAANASNPKSSTIQANILGRYGRIYNFMINIMVEGIHASSTININSNNSAFPLIVQGADNPDYRDMNIASCKAGVIIGGQWLSRNDTTSATYLPVYPAGFGTPGTYHAADVYLIGWCDNPKFSIQMAEPNGGSIVASYGTWDAAIDTFFDTYFFKSASKTSRLGPATPVPGAYTAYPGVVGMGIQIFSRYGRDVGSPTFGKMKTYGLIRSAIYVEQCYNGQVDGGSYHEAFGYIPADGAKFGVVTNDPYGTPGVDVGSFVRGSGTQIKIGPIFGFGSGAGNFTKSINFNGAFRTEGCYLNLVSDPYNNYSNLLENSLPQTQMAYSLTYKNRAIGRHVFNTFAGDDIATVDLSALAVGQVTYGKLKLGIAKSGGSSAGYANALYEFPLIFVYEQSSATLQTQGGTTATATTTGSYNIGVFKITATLATSIVGTTAHITVTPVATVGAFTTAIAWWEIELMGTKNCPITAV